MSVLGITDRTSLLFSHREQRGNYEVASDITIVAGITPDQKHFPVDSFLLKIASPKFENLVSEHINGTICVQDVRPSIMEKMLRYIYMDKYDADGAKEAMELFITAERFELPHLQSLCNNYLNEFTITQMDDISLLYEMSYENGFPNILSKTAECLFKKTDKFLENDGLSKASKEVVEKVVKNSFCVKESLLVCKVLDWCHKRNKTTTEDMREETLESILPNLLFLRLSNSEFADIVIPSGLLLPDEIAAICSNKNASDRNKLHMPDNLSCAYEREAHYIPVNLHSEPSSAERTLSANDVFSVIFLTEKDCFVEGLALPIIFDPAYVVTMSFQITLTDLQSGIKYKDSKVECIVKCDNDSNFATFKLPYSLYVKKRTPMKLKIKNLTNPANLRPVRIADQSAVLGNAQFKVVILKVSQSKGKYEWNGAAIAYIYDNLNQFQISALLLMF